MLEDFVVRRLNNAEDVVLISPDQILNRDKSPSSPHQSQRWYIRPVWWDSGNRGGGPNPVTTQPEVIGANSLNYSEESEFSAFYYEAAIGHVQCSLLKMQAKEVIEYANSIARLLE